VRTPNAARRAGFTIIEVVVAMGLLLLGMSSILGLLAFGAALSRTAQLRNAAAQSVEAVVADLEESFFPLVPDPETGELLVGEPVAVSGVPVPGYPGLTYSATPSPDTGDDSTPGGPLRYRIEIEVRCMSGGRARSKQFTTLLLRQVPFGERMRREFVQGQYDVSPTPPAETPSGETQP
jgi:type II secretory pathway pseudopilin PulG